MSFNLWNALLQPINFFLRSCVTTMGLINIVVFLKMCNLKKVKPFHHILTKCEELKSVSKKQKIFFVRVITFGVLSLCLIM